MTADFGPFQGQVPDTVPDDLAAEYGEEARRIVAASIRPRWQQVPWEEHLVAATMVAALLGIILALAFLMVAFPILGRPLMVVAVLTAALTATRSRLSRRARRG